MNMRNNAFCFCNHKHWGQWKSLRNALIISKRLNILDADEDVFFFKFMYLFSKKSETKGKVSLCRVVCHFNLSLTKIYAYRNLRSNLTDYGWSVYQYIKYKLHLVNFTTAVWITQSWKKERKCQYFSHATWSRFRTIEPIFCQSGETWLQVYWIKIKITALK